MHWFCVCKILFSLQLFYRVLKGKTRRSNKEVHNSVTLMGVSQVALVVKKNPPANAGDARDTGSIPGSGRSPGEGDGNPLQDTCLENSMDRGAWWATIHRSTILYSYQQHLRISISPQSCQHFPLSVFFIIAIPVDMKQYLIVLCTFFEAKYIVLRF